MLQSMGSQRVRHDWATEHTLEIFLNYFVTKAIDATEILWGLYEHSSMSVAFARA